MRRGCLFFLLLAGGAFRCPAAPLPLLLQEAQAAAREGIWAVSLMKLRALFQQPDLPVPERQTALLLQSESLASTGQHEEALSTLQPLITAGLDRAELLRAGILARLGRWSEALPWYRAAAPLPGAALGEAEALQALGRLEEAADLLEKLAHGSAATTLLRLRLVILRAELHQIRPARELLAATEASSPEEIKWRAYAEGRLLLLEDQPAPALTLFEGILQQREHLPENLLVAATFGSTDARIRLNGSEAADSTLETFIWRYPSSVWLAHVFRRLDQLYAQEEDPPESELRKWAQKPEAARAALARFYLAQMQWRRGKVEKAGLTLEAFLRTAPGHPLMAQAHLLHAEILSFKGEFAETIAALEAAMRLTEDPELRATIELRTGLANFQQGEFLLAANLFESAARHSAKVAAVATFDAALAWLHQGNDAHFTQQFRNFLREQPESPLRGELLLEAGLVQARTGDPRAPASLQSFLQDSPQAPRQAEARLALMELAVVRGETNHAPGGAEALRTAAGEAIAPEIAAAADYLAIFQADAQTPRNDEQVIELGQKFLREHAQAPQLPEVRLKLGQVYFRREDYANAETQFARLAAEPDAGASLEAALYLAGESAMKLINPGAVDRALQYFERVVKLEGNFRLYARQEQAVVQSRLEHEDQAIALYELILGAQPPAGPDLRYAALCGKGDNLLALGRRELPRTERFEQAIEAYRQLAATPQLPALWRNQALYKMGKALEQVGRREEALTAYYDALNRTTAEEREFFWFFKAGFDAAQLLEQQEQWAAAVGIYTKMTKVEGPRTAEAGSRLRQLRLEHFLWE